MFVSGHLLLQKFQRLNARAMGWATHATVQSSAQDSWLSVYILLVLTSGGLLVVATIDASQNTLLISKYMLTVVNH